MPTHFGFTDSIDSADSPADVLRDASPGVVADVIVRANDAGIYIGGSSVKDSLPGTGFELEAGKDYHFTVAEGGLFIATTSATPVTWSAVYLPAVH